MKTLKFIIAASAILIAAGCSTKGRVNEIVSTPEAIGITNHYAGSVSVFVTGGEDRLVSSATFAEALVKTINDLKLFESATLSSGSKYKLSVAILSMVHGFLGYVNKVSSLWTLSTSDGVELWSETIDGNGNSGNFGGVARHRESAERAAKAVIESGVAKLSEMYPIVKTKMRPN